MKTHNHQQGTAAWLAYRAAHFNASDAPAMLGCSPYKTRAALLRELHTGMAADVDASTQRIFDAGHRFEALARPLAEKIVGEDLYPVVGSEGRLSASFDGLTLAEDIVFEHKTAGAALRDAMTDEDCGATLPLHYRVQMEQQLMVSGAGKALFMATLWDGETCTFSRHCWYYPDEELRADILRGWDQFAADLAAYTLPPAAEAVPVGKAPETLPALRIEMIGQVTASNLDEFKATALAAIRSVNRDLKTDADFADADKAVKWCADVESKLKAAKEHALSQTASIDALFKMLDDIGAESKAVRLDLGKVIERRKVERKEEAVTAARRELDAHIAALNGELAPMALRTAPVDFGGAIKGLRSFASMDDALHGAVASAKIAADAQARGIRANVAAFKAAAAGLEFLFSDLGQIVHKATDDFATLLQARIDAHRVAEAAREAKRQADEAARIAAAEKHAREAAEQAALERENQRISAARAESDRLEALAVANRALLTPMPALKPAEMASVLRVIEGGITEVLRPDGTGIRITRGDKVSFAATAEPATLNLTAINARFKGCIKLDAAGLALMGIEHSATDKAAKLYRESDVRRVCAALVRLGEEVAGEVMA